MQSLGEVFPAPSRSSKITPAVEEHQRGCYIYSRAPHQHGDIRELKEDFIIRTASSLMIQTIGVVQTSRRCPQMVRRSAFSHCHFLAS